MRTLKQLGLVFLLLASFLVQSCEEKQDLKGKIDFSVMISGEDLKKSITNDSTSNTDSMYTWHLLVSVVSVNGEVILEDEIIPLYSFGSGFISEKIEVPAGEFLLEKFMVINPYGQVQYAAPVAGSPKAYLVNHPLPLEFSVSPGQVSNVSPEVLPVGDVNPGEFGYASFSFNVVTPIIAYVMAVDDNPLYMRPSVSIPAVLSLYARDGWMYHYKLNVGVNKILVKSGYEYFKVIVENPEFPPYEGEISVRELMNSTEDNPVIFNLGQEPLHSLIIQPGPEAGKDAMITDLEPQKNFGSHLYFEASYLTEPVLTVMRTKQSLVQFPLGNLPKSAVIRKVTLSLWFENIVWDTLWEGLDNYMIREQQLVLQQIVEPWEEYRVSWANQPKTIEANQVFIPIWDEMSANVRTYDVTSFFVPYQEIAAPNYGMMLKMAGDNYYPGGWQFVSSDYRIAEMRPRLTVYYDLY